MLLKLRSRVVLATMAVALIAAACGGGDDPLDETTEEGAPEGSGQIDVAAVWTGPEQENFEAVLDAFTEATGVETNYVSTGDDVGAYLGTQIEGGNPPDVAMLPQPGLLRDLAAAGSLSEANEDVATALGENFQPIWTDLGSHEGTLYGVYFKVANKSTWWYNTASLDAAGVEPPATWDEMIDAAGTVNASGVPWVSMGGADGWTLTDWFENIYIQTAGTDAYDQLATHQIPWTDDTVITALETWAELVGDEANLAGGVDGALQTDFTTSVTKVFADPPEAATVFEGDFVGGVISAETGATLGEDADFFTFPQIDDAPASIIGGGDVAVALSDDASAQQLLAFLATPEAAEVWASIGGFTSANQNLDTAVYPDDITARSAEAVASAEVFRFDLSDLQPAAFGGTVGKGLFLRFQDFVRAPDDPMAVAEALEREAARAFR